MSDPDVDIQITDEVTVTEETVIDAPRQMLRHFMEAAYKLPQVGLYQDLYLTYDIYQLLMEKLLNDPQHLRQWIEDLGCMELSQRQAETLRANMETWHRNAGVDIKGSDIHEDRLPVMWRVTRSNAFLLLLALIGQLEASNVESGGKPLQTPRHKRESPPVARLGDRNFHTGSRLNDQEVDRILEFLTRDDYSDQRAFLLRLLKAVVDSQKGKPAERLFARHKEFLARARSFPQGSAEREDLEGQRISFLRRIYRNKMNERIIKLMFGRNLFEQIVTVLRSHKIPLKAQEEIIEFYMYALFSTF